MEGVEPRRTSAVFCGSNRKLDTGKSERKEVRGSGAHGASTGLASGTGIMAGRGRKAEEETDLGAPSQWKLPCEPV